MQNRISTVGCLLIAVALATGPSVLAQTPQDAAERTGRCFTPVSTTGVYYLVTAGGATEQILRSASPAARSTRHTVTHSMPHSQMSVTATARVRVPGIESHIDGELFSRLEKAPVQPPAIDSMQVRPSHRHASAFDVVINSATGTTGCRLRLK
jgi:hypothetical protein